MQAVFLEGDIILGRTEHKEEEDAVMLGSIKNVWWRSNGHRIKPWASGLWISADAMQVESCCWSEGLSTRNMSCMQSGGQCWFQIFTKSAQYLLIF